VRRRADFHGLLQRGYIVRSYNTNGSRSRCENIVPYKFERSVFRDDGSRAQRRRQRVNDSVDDDNPYQLILLAQTAQSSTARHALARKYPPCGCAV
jgi:hypothetical protein